MKKALIACAAGALLVAPGATAKPTKTDRTNAAKECRAERGTTDFTVEAFRVKYGTNKSGRNAFGKCVSGTSKEEAAERRAAARNAAKECKALRTAMGVQNFADTYGTNGNKRNAYGRCGGSNRPGRLRGSCDWGIRRRLVATNQKEHAAP